MAQSENEKFLIEFNAIKLLTMAVTKVILENSRDSEQSANKLIGMINEHVKVQRIEGLDVQETEAVRKAITQRVEALVNSVKAKPGYLRQGR